MVCELVCELVACGQKGTYSGSNTVPYQTSTNRYTTLYMMSSIYDELYI